MRSPLSRPVFTRFSHLRLVSLLASFFGGAVLIFVGANGLLMNGVAISASQIARPAQYGVFDWKKVNYYDTYRGFRYGPHLEIQTWIAILGVGFGLASYGLAEANHHLFDWWCTWRASHGKGLDYSRYLNSQNRAPVAYGIRGFPQFTTLRYLVTGISIAASIAYKFGIVQTEIVVYEMSLDWGYGSQPVMIHGTTPTLASFEDKPFSSNTRFFYPVSSNTKKMNQTGPDPYFHMIPPSAVILLGEKVDSTTDKKHRLGRQTNQEMAIVANVTEQRGGFEMQQNQEDWNQVLVDHWFQNGSAVVDYRVYNSTQVQIQWASPGRWYNSSASNLSAPVLQRLTYEMRHAFLEVERFVRVDKSSFDQRDDETVRILSMGREPIDLPYNKTTLPTKWINALLEDPGFIEYEWREVRNGSSWQNYRDPRLLNGVGRFIQIIMSKLPLGGCDLPGEEPEFMSGDCPFWRDEDRVKDPPNDAQNPLSIDAERIAFSRKPFSQYPFFTGMATVSGCRPELAGIFIGIGVFSILLRIVRICVGPPRLTSWVGQHVYLAKAGMINLDTEKLASGYDAAPKHAGTLRLKVAGGKEEDKIRDDTREGSEEEMLGQETAGSE